MRPIRRATNARPEVKAAKRSYDQSAKGRAKKTAYYASEAGKVARARWNRSPRKLQAERQRRARPLVAQAHRDDVSAYQRTEGGKRTHERATRKHNMAHPERYRARTAVNNAVRDGRLHRQRCGRCGAMRAEGHHPDYSKPLDVDWLCGDCHREEHRASPSDGTPPDPPR